MIVWTNVSSCESYCTISGHTLTVGLERDQDKDNIYWTVHCEGYISYQKIYIKSRTHAKNLALRRLRRELVLKLAHDTRFLKIIEEDN